MRTEQILTTEEEEEDSPLKVEVPNLLHPRSVLGQTKANEEEPRHRQGEKRTWTNMLGMPGADKDRTKQS